MSRPSNVLHKYRSYAYHQLLIACDSTQTAESLLTKGNVTELERSAVNRFNRDKKFDGMSTAGGAGDNYVVLIDGLVDSDFYITQSNWSTIIRPNKTGQQTMAQVDGSLEIFEPYGAVFLERIVDMCDTLRTDPLGVVFLLKTVFVGFNDQHHRFNQEMIPDSKPLLFTLVDLTSVIDETGSTHTLQFVGAANGFGKLKYANMIGKGFSIEINRGDSLVAAFAKVEEELNQEYEEFAKSLGLEFNSQAPFNGANKKAPIGIARPDITDKTEYTNGGEFRPVRYIIEASDYQDSGFEAASNELERNENVNSVTLQFGSEQNIEGILKSIMVGCNGVTKDANGEKDKYIFKINSFLRSTPTEVIVEYQINRYREAIWTMSQITKKGTPDLGPQPNIREYDYIFTGNNTDIIEFDIKMDMGLSFFHKAAMTEYNLDQKSEIGGKADTTVPGGKSSGGQASRTGKPRGKTPLFLGDKITDPKTRNKKYTASVAGFNAMLSRHAQMENIGVTMKIHGDPALMSEMLVTNTLDAINAETKQTYMTAPAFVKVNIKMPDNKNNPGKFKQFWFDGYYLLTEVETNFEDGRFTQVLHMISIPVTSAIDEAIDRVDKEEKKGDVLKSTGEPVSTPADAIGDTLSVLGMIDLGLGKPGQ